MDKIFILYTNQKMKYATEKELKEELLERYEKIELLLIPVIDYGIDGWIPIKPNPLLEDIAHCTIIYRIIVRYLDYHENFFLKEKVKKMSKECSSIIELYNFLHGLDKMDYANSILSTNIEGAYDTFCIDIDRFEIEILNKKYESIFRKKVRIDQVKDDGRWYSMIYRDLQELYNPLLPEGDISCSEIIQLDAEAMKWKRLSADDIRVIQEEPVHYTMIGIAGIDTGLIYFLNEERFVNFLYTEAAQLNVIANMNVPRKQFNCITFTYTAAGVSSVLELISFLPYISYSILLVINTNLAQGSLNINRNVSISFKAYIDVSVSADNHTISLQFNPNNIPTVHHFEEMLQIYTDMNEDLGKGVI